jgi:hypothetical protein
MHWKSTCKTIPVAAAVERVPAPLVRERLLARASLVQASLESVQPVLARLAWAKPVLAWLVRAKLG